jgi:hypothetical protein
VTKASKEFEKRVFQLVSLLEEAGATVTLDKHIADPDTGQSRQIDIEIVSPSGLRTHVECRDRSRKEDVVWIESLAGRRQSLQADVIMAVSASGFNANAVIKARALGIEIRSLLETNVAALVTELTPPELSIVVVSNFEMKVKYVTFERGNDVLAQDILKDFAYKGTESRSLSQFLFMFLYSDHPKRDEMELGHKYKLSYNDVIIKQSGSALRFIDITLNYSLVPMLLHPTKQIFFRSVNPDTEAMEHYKFQEFGIKADFILSEGTYHICLDLSDYEPSRGQIVLPTCKISQEQMPGSIVNMRVVLPEDFNLRDFVKMNVKVQT